MRVKIPKPKRCAYVGYETRLYHNAVWDPGYQDFIHLDRFYTRGFIQVDTYPPFKKSSFCSKTHVVFSFFVSTNFEFGDLPTWIESSGLIQVSRLPDRTYICVQLFRTSEPLGNKVVNNKLRHIAQQQQL